MDKLVSLLRSLRGSEPRIIGIDGELGCGKTTVARRVSKELECKSLHLDSYLREGPGSFA